LRALEQRTIRRVGGSKEISLDVRIVAATNRDLHRQMAKGEFREDLYYRLAVAHLRVPPLRDRREDIPMLARHLLANFHKDAPNIPVFPLTLEILESLQARPWRGNVRELRNVLQRAFVTSELAVPSPSEAGDEFAPLSEVPLEMSYQEARDVISSRFEQTYLRHALERYKGNVAKTARECGMDRATLFRLIKKHGIERPT
jgi:DNA-binding NtrC family response regulator